VVSGVFAIWRYTLQKRTKDSVRCSEFGGGRFSEVANVLQVWDFQSVTRALSALGSVSASRSVRSGRFYCNPVLCWLLVTINNERGLARGKMSLSLSLILATSYYKNIRGIRCYV